MAAGSFAGIETKSNPMAPFGAKIGHQLAEICVLKCALFLRMCSNLRCREQKPSIYELYTQQDSLSATTVKRTLNYLDEFYRTINDPTRLDHRILSTCR